MMRKLMRAALTASLLASSARGDDMDIPLDVQLPLLLKVMTYDQNAAERSPNGFYVAVAYSSSIPQSIKAKDTVMPTVSKLRMANVDDKPVSWAFVDLGKPGELARLFKAEPITAVYVTPGLRAHIPEIVKICQESRATTLTGVSAYVSEGLSVAVAQEGGKPKIVVNLAASKAEGSSFSASLLGLARVIR